MPPQETPHNRPCRNPGRSRRRQQVGSRILGLPPGTPTATHSYGSQFPVAPKTNGFAVASLVCSLAGTIFIGGPAILGIIFGFVARDQVSRSHGVWGGDGMALAGIIVGFFVVGLWVLVFTLSALSGTHHAN
jgi:Domain of unknown function (DUF4190)